MLSGNAIAMAARFGKNYLKSFFFVKLKSFKLTTVISVPYVFVEHNYCKHIEINLKKNVNKIGKCAAIRFNILNVLLNLLDFRLQHNVITNVNKIKYLWMRFESPYFRGS